MKEKTLVNKIVNYLNEQPGCYARKIHGSRFSAGFPDIHATWQGRSLWFEVKTLKGRLTPLQEKELIKWRNAGATAMVVRGLAEVETLFLPSRLEGIK